MYLQLIGQEGDDLGGVGGQRFCQLFIGVINKMPL
jgi:hypothetical protein